MNDLQVFNNPEFGDIRAVEIDGEPWFVAADVCRILDLGNPSQALSRLDEDEKSNTLISNEGIRGNPNVAIVNEPGLYTLVLGSRKPEVKPIKRWLAHDVIPAIRKHGAYVAPNTQPQGLETFAAALETLTAAVQTLTQRLDQQEQNPRRRALPPPQALDDDNPFADYPVPIKPPSNKARRSWMRTASEKLNALADKCGIPSSSVLHSLYQELEEEQGVILSEVRLKALEEHQLTDCSILLAIFYDTTLRHWFEKRVDQYLSAGTPAW